MNESLQIKYLKLKKLFVDKQFYNANFANQKLTTNFRKMQWTNCEQVQEC